MTSSKIFGPDGKPIGPSEEQGLQVLIDTAVEVKVNTAIDNLREANRKEGRVRYAALIVINVLVVVVLYFFGPDIVRDWTKEFVAKNMNQPLLQKAADEIMDSSMKGYIDNKLLDTEQRLKTVVEQLHNLTAEQEYLAISYHAQLFDFNAFKRLESIASAPNSPFSGQAKELIGVIKRRLSFDRANFMEIIPVEKINGTEFQGPFSNDEIAERLMLKDPEPAVNYIRLHNLKVFTPELVKLLDNEQNLNLLNRISYALSKITGKEFEAWDIEKMKEWWAAESNNYEKWPVDKYKAGCSFFIKNKYSDALPEFKAVLKVDPTADKSRALAIACSVEIGNINDVKEIIKGFKDQNSRWKKWAEAKVKIGDGNAKEATDMIIQLLKQHSTFKQAFFEGRTNIWKDLEWERIEQAIK